MEGRTTVDWDFRNPEHHVLHQHAVAPRAIEFLNFARDVYSEDQELGKILENPITHRLLELVMTTIPS